MTAAVSSITCCSTARHWNSLILDVTYGPCYGGEIARWHRRVHDLSRANDRIIAFDYAGTGKQDHLVMYRPGGHHLDHLEKLSDNTFSPVYSTDGLGIGGYDGERRRRRVCPRLQWRWPGRPPCRCIEPNLPDIFRGE